MRKSAPETNVEVGFLPASWTTSSTHGAAVHVGDAASTGAGAKAKVVAATATAANVARRVRLRVVDRPPVVTARG